MALHLKPSTIQGPSHLLPRHLELELSRHVLRTTARFRLRAHTLRVETGCWQIHKRLCDKCDLHDVQTEKHVLFLCPCLEMCYLRRRFAELANCTGRTYSEDTGAFYFDSIGAEDVNCFSWSRNTNHFFFFLRLWIFFVWLAVSSKPSSQSIWWKVYTNSNLTSPWWKKLTALWANVSPSP